MFKNILGLSVVGVIICGCANYGDPTTYSSLTCESMRSLYGNSAKKLFQSTNLASSQLGQVKPGKIVIASPSNKIENIIDKQESDLRAAYKANGC